jgi:hypothetical protein
MLKLPQGTMMVLLIGVVRRVLGGNFGFNFPHQLVGESFENNRLYLI